MTNASEDWPRRVAVLGVGLLGGSVAMSLRRARPTITVVGFARSDEKRQSLLEKGIIDVAAASVSEACVDCDAVVVASPVDRIAAMAIEAAGASPADCLITDVGSTKAQIVDAVERDEKAAEKFLAAHPIAGSEKTGADHALATLFEAKVIVLTPSDQTSPDLLGKAVRFWEMTGGVIRQLSPAAHDAHLAAVSHVPHLVSALVAKMVEPEARPLVGSGWRDITRVAAGDPGLWTAICQENRHAISRQLARLADQLTDLRGLIDGQDDAGLASWLAEAKEIKEQTTSSKA